MERAKKRKKEKENSHDRISDLPNEVLCNILSFLPSQTAVTTSLLAHRWRYVWIDVEVISVSSEEVYVGDEVNHMFSKFKFVCRISKDFKPDGYIENYQLGSWIKEGIKRSVEDLTLSFPTSIPKLTLPNALFSCRTLVSLKLCDNVIIDSTAIFFLPCLMSLPILKHRGQLRPQEEPWACTMQS
ncbi:hypothetical protein like AT1G66310 [Hibiscus trionum]|uniref:F-box domain-containing protein n=1 Tax=Hibiscus trionum TaxID=183268 RepID=A0A9W7M8K9_HIBTR|nr:hypothetical protein like AT1G66310 [Hibiscus trionum]